VSNRKCVVVSTHLDDAVFSCFGIVAGASSVVTVFAGVPPPTALGDWDVQTGATDAAARMRLRRREDENALLETNARPVHLQLLESQHTAALHLPPTRLHEICRALAPHIDDADYVYAPMGLGHPEHQLVRDAVLALRADAALYADLPYALRMDPDIESRTALTSARQRSERTLSVSSHARKLDACRRYRTQLEPLTALHGDFMTTAGLRTEVLWSLPRPASEPRFPPPIQAPAPASSAEPALSAVPLTRGPARVLARLLQSLERAEGSNGQR
jgi:LmbE family N-acetylglucosaminyl deacetylase